MDLRRENRVLSPMNITVSGLGGDGQIRVQQAQTLDISGEGCCLSGLEYCFEPGTILGIRNGERRARFRVVWKGEPGTPRQGQMGLERLGGTKQASTRLFYVDGPAESAESRKAILQALCYDVVLGTSGRDALERLQQERFSALILGYPLSDMEAADVLVRLRRAELKSKVLLLSAYPKVEESLLELADGFICKRQSNTEFISGIELVLNGHKRVKFPVGRNFFRYAVRVPLTVEVLRSGTRETFYGLSRDLSEHGISGQIQSQFIPGELVKVSFSLPNCSHEFKAEAIVRHRSEQLFGFEFVSINARARESIKALCAVLPSISLPKASS